MQERILEMLLVYEQGHMAKDCPSQGTHGIGSGRFYTLDVKKIKGNNNLIAGMCYLNN